MSQQVPPSSESGAGGEPALLQQGQPGVPILGPDAPVDLEQVRRVAASPPLFMLGNLRSGTTVLGLAVNSHPRIDMAFETGMIVDLALRPGLPSSPPELLDAVFGYSGFRHLRLDPNRVRRTVSALGASDFAAICRVIFALHAVDHGKSRWGDKHPKYVFHLSTVAGLFPDAIFVHVVRDGRESAASGKENDFGFASVVTGAYLWRKAVRSARAQGRPLGADRYLEVHLEDFIADPETTSRRICEFAGEPFDAAMLAYHERQHDGIPARQMEEKHSNTTRPPTAGLRDWRRGLSPADVQTTDVLLRSTLQAFGYEAAPRGSLPSEAWHELRARLVIARSLPSNLTPVARHLLRSASAASKRLSLRSRSPRGRTTPR